MFLLFRVGVVPFKGRYDHKKSFPPGFLPFLDKKKGKKAIYFFEMSVLFETGELNAYVYDGGGLYRRKYV